MAAWRLYVILMQREHKAEQGRQTTQNKMAAFLDAAASGRLWTDSTCKTPSDQIEVPSANDANEPKVSFIKSQLLHLIFFVNSAA